jgi:RimJ/RimL family protein N-acetyltransferase
VGVSTLLPTVELRTARLLLRPAALHDLAAIVAGCNDPEVMRFIPETPVPYTEDDGREWIAHAPQRWQDSREIAFVVTEPPSQECLGVATVRVVNGGSVGYWLARDARGKGLMAEALTALTEWSANEHGVRRLTLTTHPDNAASQHTAIRAGFRSLGRTTHTAHPHRDGRAESELFEWHAPAARRSAP